MLSEEIKENLKQNNILLINIHQLGYELEKSKEERTTYINELKDFLDKNTNYIISSNTNEVLKIINKEDSQESLSIMKYSDYINIHVFSHLDLDDSYYNRYLALSKEITIYNKNYSYLSGSLLFKFEFDLKGEEECDILNYRVEALADNRKNRIELYCGEAGDTFEIVTKELEKDDKITKDFFDVLSLSTDLNTKHLEEVFLPVFGMEDRNLKLKEQLLNISKKSIKNIF